MSHRNLSAHPLTLPSGRVLGPGEEATDLSEEDAAADGLTVGKQPSSRKRPKPPTPTPAGDGDEKEMTA